MLLDTSELAIINELVCIHHLYNFCIDNYRAQEVLSVIDHAVNTFLAQSGFREGQERLFSKIIGLYKEAD